MVSRWGGRPYVAPTVEIKPPRNRRLIKDFVKRVLSRQIDFVIFMSANGVTELIKSLENSELKNKFVRELSRVKVVAVGPKTGRELRNRGIEANLVPPKYSSKGIVESLEKIGLQGKNVAIPRSNKAGTYLRRELEKMDANILEVPVYQSVLPSDESKVLDLIYDLLAGEIDAITFTSSSTVQNLFEIASKHALAEKLRNGLKKTIVVVIGPTTQRTLKKLGLRVDVMPKEYTIEGMMKALVSYMHTY